jgi:hypothetical protein
VRDERDRVSSATRTFQARNNVFHSSRDLIAESDAGGALNFGSDTETGELGNQIVAYAVMFRGAYGMGRGREGLEIKQSAVRGESILGR